MKYTYIPELFYRERDRGERRGREVKELERRGEGRETGRKAW